MIYDFTDEEQKQIDNIEASYAKLLKENEKRIKKARPDEDEHIKDMVRLQNTKPAPPEMPSPKEFRNGVPVYSKEELDAYHNSKAYKAYRKEIARIVEEVDDFHQAWYNAGSDEWKEAKAQRDELLEQLYDTRTAFYKKVEKRHFDNLGDDQTDILIDAQSQVDRLIVSNYKYYEELQKKGTFTAIDVRAKKDGGFLLDTTKEREVILRAIEPHIKRLKKSLVEQLYSYTDDALARSEYVGDDGELWGKVEKSEYDGYFAVRPMQYLTTVDRVSKLAFDNKLTKPVDSKPEALWDVDISARKSKNDVVARVAINYAELLKNGDFKELPELTSDDYSIHDAVLSLRHAGNYVFSQAMIYRVLTGKIKGDIEVPDEMKELIDKAFAKFKGELNIEYTKKDKDGNEVKLRIKEPILTYMTGDGYINGKYIDKLYITPNDSNFTPPFEKWARFNGNEIDTRDVTLLDIPRLNNGKESREVKMCLYRRLISMRNTFERVKKCKHELALNQRTIRYDYVYDAIGIKSPDKNKRRLVKDKIDRCAKYWKSKGLISDYEHKKDKSSGNQYYALVVTFMPVE